MALTASARVPVRPLDYANVTLAMPKELLVDYKTGEVYVSDETGKVIMITESVKQTVIQEIVKDDQFTSNLATDTEFTDSLANNNDFVKDIATNENLIKNLNITYSDGSTENIQVALVNNIEQVTHVLKSLGYKENSDGTVTFEVLQKLEDAMLTKEADGTYNIKIKASNVVTDSSHRFITDAERTTWNNKANKPDHLFPVILGGESNWTGTVDGSETKAPYTQRVDVAEILESDSPIVDIKLGDIYDTNMKQLDSYAYIYRIITYNGYIIVHATKPTEVDITVQMKVDR